MIDLKTGEILSDQAYSGLGGVQTPRIHSKLNDLPSKGQEMIDFATELGINLMEWQKFVAIHGHKVKPDGIYFYLPDTNKYLLKKIEKYRTLEEDVEVSNKLLEFTTNENISNRFFVCNTRRLYTNGRNASWTRYFSSSPSAYFISFFRQY